MSQGDGLPQLRPRGSRAGRRRPLVGQEQVQAGDDLTQVPDALEQTFVVTEVGSGRADRLRHTAMLGSPLRQEGLGGFQQGLPGLRDQAEVEEEAEGDVDLGLLENLAIGEVVVVLQVREFEQQQGLGGGPVGEG